jgi:hypothetical protein
MKARQASKNENKESPPEDKAKEKEGKGTSETAASACTDYEQHQMLSFAT